MAEEKPPAERRVRLRVVATAVVALLLGVGLLPAEAGRPVGDLVSVLFG